MLTEVCAIRCCRASLLKSAMDKLKFVSPGVRPDLKSGRTIADLAESEEIKPEHLAEAIQYRSLDREGWAG